MDSEIFVFQKQRWAPIGPAELTFSLSSDGPCAGQVYLHLDADFVPEWVMALPEGRDTDEEHRKMHLSVFALLPPIGHLPSLHGLVDLVVEESEGVTAPDGTVIRPDVSAPDVSLWSSGQGAGSLHFHERDGWQTRIRFGDWQTAHVIDYEVHAFYPSDRNRHEREKEMYNLVCDWFGDPPEHEIDQEILREGYTLRHRGLAEFQDANCTVPVNAPDPIGYAQGMAQRQLGMTRFGWSYVLGGSMDGTWEPGHGVTEHGRMVSLTPYTVAYAQWKERRDRRKLGE